MPSSLIFAALAVAWLVVLVPMIAKRRQEVERVADAALASRVLRRPARSRGARPRRPGSFRVAPEHDQEVPVMGEEIVERGLMSEERQYRPGRGGYDPEAAALAARARYLFRQRVVFGLIAAAILTLVLGFVLSVFWSVHAVLDTVLIAYLGYLRRQVRIEKEVRERRSARMAGSRGRASTVEADGAANGAPVGWSGGEGTPEVEYPSAEQPGRGHPRHEDQRGADQRCAGSARYDQAAEAEQPSARHVVVSPAHPASPPPPHPTAVALDVDDDDPVFDDLDPAFEPPYRRAAGE